MTLKLTDTPTGVKLSIKVVPGASKTRMVGLLDGALKITLAAAPEKGKANKELLRFLANLLDLPKSSLSIISGEHNARKEIFISQITPQTLQTKLQSHLQ